MSKTIPQIAADLVINEVQPQMKKHGITEWGLCPVHPMLLRFVAEMKYCGVYTHRDCRNVIRAAFEGRL